MIFEEVKDLSEIFFSPVSTINIPNKKANSAVLTDERKKEFSLYMNAKRNKADTAPYFNWILPLLRQNADFGAQKHCIEIVDLATTL